jgi:Zn-dependent peptidase ImmA (M78 family)
MLPFHAPFLPKERIWERVEEFRKTHTRARNVPFDVLDLAELDLGMELIPISRLRECWDIEALISQDMGRIYVDNNIFTDPKQENRLRFSISHEIGHSILHKSIYDGFSYDNINEWQRVIESIPEDQYSFIEWQAYEFAGRLLVPIERLTIEFERSRKKIIETAGTAINYKSDMAISYMAREICKVFRVSSIVIEKRIRVEIIGDD